MFPEVYIKIHDSESRGQEETAIIHEIKNTRPLSGYLQGNPFRKLLPLYLSCHKRYH